MAGIKNLKVRAVRGVRGEVQLEPKGRSLLVQGDNGTGKSSIVQALGWVLRDEAPPLIDATKGEEAYRGHVLEEPSSPEVVVEFSDGSTLKAVAGMLTACEGAMADSYRESCTRADPFLRRRQLLQFLGQRPVDRFKYLESFLDLEEADEIRAKLAERASTLTARANSLRQNREKALNAINATLPGGRQPLAVTWDALERVIQEWARELGLLGREAIEWRDIELVAEQAEESAKDHSASRRKAQGDILLKSMTSLQPAIEGLPDLSETGAALKEKVRATVDGGLVSLLEHARSHFESAPRDKCPVCEQGIDSSTVAKSIRDRLSALSSVRTLSQSHDAAAGAWLQTVGRFVDARKQADDYLVGSDSLPALGALEGWSFVADAKSSEQMSEAVSAVGATKVQAWLMEAATALRHGVANAVSQIPTDDKKADLILFGRVVKEATRQRASTDLVSRIETAVEKEAKVLGEVADAIRKARQDVAQNLLNKIAGTVTEFYREIHPEDSESEVTGAPTIDVQRKSGGIALLRGSFDGNDVDDPRWVYSDGHLDTVGICVFLALRRFRANQSRDAKLMILDDVVLSIDLGHARRLLAVLHQHFSDHQILLFTHNGLFASWVGDLLPGIQRKIITGWTLAGGVHIGDLRSSAEHLRGDIEDSTSAKELAQSMMTLMDEFLVSARYVHEMAVPARRGEQYTLSDVWDPFKKRMGELAKALKAPLGQTGALLAQLVDLPRVRNQLGAHENDFAKEFPLSTIREYCRKSLRLYEALYCESCCSFAEPAPGRKKPWAVCCRCKKLAYLSPELQAVAADESKNETRGQE